ncbi:hypothetical protein D3C87_2183910 [compost metagenome]
MKSLPEAPMAEARRHAVRAEGVDNVGGANFVAHRVEIEAESFGNLGDLGYRPFERLYFIAGHE